MQFKFASLCIEAPVNFLTFKQVVIIHECCFALRKSLVMEIEFFSLFLSLFEILFLAMQFQIYWFEIGQGRFGRSFRYEFFFSLYWRSCKFFWKSYQSFIFGKAG